MDDLCDDLMKTIFDVCYPSSALQLRLVSKSWYNISGDDFCKRYIRVYPCMKSVMLDHDGVIFLMNRHGVYDEKVIEHYIETYRPQVIKGECLVPVLKVIIRGGHYKLLHQVITMMRKENERGRVMKVLFSRSVLREVATSTREIIMVTAIYGEPTCIGTICKLLYVSVEFGRVDVLRIVVEEVHSYVDKETLSHCLILAKAFGDRAYIEYLEELLTPPKVEYDYDYSDDDW